MMAEVAVGWLLLDAARISIDASAKLDAGHADKAFYEGKKAAAQYFARNVLPGVQAKADLFAVEDTSALDIPTEAF